MSATASCTIRTFCPALLLGKTPMRYQANLAAGTVVVVPVLVFGVLIQRYLVRGLAMGAVKG